MTHDGVDHASRFPEEAVSAGVVPGPAESARSRSVRTVDPWKEIAEEVVLVAAEEAMRGPASTAARRAPWTANQVCTPGAPLSDPGL